LPDAPWSLHGGEILLHVRLTPKSSRDELGGVAILADGRRVLKARVRAVPENGKANEALLQLVAKTLRIPQTAITLQAGASGRIKTLCLKDARNLIAELERLWPGP
jgi:uncharacterized protein